MRNIVKTVRKEQGIKQEVFAKMIQISRQSLSAIENGTVPSGDTMLKIAKKLNKQVEDIFFLNSVV